MELGEPDASGRRSPVAVEGKFETLEVDNVICAIGQKVNVAGFEEIELNRWGIISADERYFTTSLEGVFAVGDATNKGASIAIDAIGEANKAASVIDGYLNGMDTPYVAPVLSKREPEDSYFEQFEKAERIKMPIRPAEERKHDFKEINLGFEEEKARAEAARCLECGCHDYEDCKLIRYTNQQPVQPERLFGSKHQCFTEQRLVTIERDQGKCILCGLCVRVCDEVAHQGLLGLIGRGFGTEVKPEFRGSDKIQVCKDCHKCALACPTGALKIIG